MSHNYKNNIKLFNKGSGTAEIIIVLAYKNKIVSKNK